jgi:CRP-like cAMP-binding protein
MSCNPEVLKTVPLFSLLDDEELAVLASQVELRDFAPRQRIYKSGDPSEHAYIMVSGSVQVTTIDEDNQVVLLDMPIQGDVFGFASMLAQTPHQTDATAEEHTECIEMDRNDLTVLLHKKPDAGLDLMTVLGKQFHAAERLVRLRAVRNPNDLIEEAETLGERLADMVASMKPGSVVIDLAAERGGNCDLTVPDQTILQAIASLGRVGIFAEPAGAAAYAGLLSALNTGLIQPDDPVLVLNTGSGLKDIKAAMQAAPQAPVIEPTLPALERLLQSKGT